MILDWLKTYALAIVGVAALAGWLGVGVQQLRVAGAKADLAKAERRHADAARLAEESARLASETYRREEQRRAQATQEAINAAHKEAERARADLAVADAAAGRLRERVAALVAAAREAASNPGPAEGSPPAATAPDLLAELLGRCVARVVELGSYADAAHAAGSTCERISDEVRGGE